jgi:chromosome segregation ATPase
MRDEQEEKGFNPVKFGLLGALLVAAVVAFLLWLQSHNQTVEALRSEQALTVQQLEQTKKERDDLQNKLVELTASSHATSTQFKKQLILRESQLSTVKKQKEAESRAAEAKLTQLQKDKSAAETQIADLRKEVESKSQDLKKVQDQIAKGQLDLQKVKKEMERAQRSYDELQRKIRTIEDGEEAAADAMIQQLAEARRLLKEEREVRRRLQEELDLMRNEPPQ